jgi:hypothetical protein
VIFFGQSTLPGSLVPTEWDGGGVYNDATGVGTGFTGFDQVCPSGQRYTAFQTSYPNPGGSYAGTDPGDLVLTVAGTITVPGCPWIVSFFGWAVLAEASSPNVFPAYTIGDAGATYAPVPEPGVWALLGLGIAALVWTRFTGRRVTRSLESPERCLEPFLSTSACCRSCLDVCLTATPIATLSS